jgi:hypothetical protein
MSQLDMLTELLRGRRIGNQNDRNVALNLIGHQKVFGYWTWKQRKLAEQLIERWTEPSNVARCEREKAKAHADG